jgi:hypothetical protein
MPIIVIIMGVLIVAGTIVYFLVPAPSTNPEPTAEIRIEDSRATIEIETTTEPTTPNEVESATNTNETKTASATYLTPRRTEHTVAVALVIENGLVTGSTVEFDGQTAGTYSNDNQNRFDQAYKTEVIGKRLEDINLARVGGASLTSIAFNEAVQKMLSQN